MSHILVIVVFAIISIAISVFVEDDARVLRGLLNAVTLTIIVVLVYGSSLKYGVFGIPISLDNQSRYRVLSVTPLSDNSTAVILRKENGSIVPIKFLTLVVADTNGFYTIVGKNYYNKNLVPIK